MYPTVVRFMPFFRFLQRSIFTAFDFVNLCLKRVDLICHSYILGLDICHADHQLESPLGALERAGRTSIGFDRPLVG